MTISDIESPQVTIVIVTYQCAKYIAANLAMVKRCVDLGIARCVVVDNGSTDGTAAILAKEAEWADIICTGINNGFGRGCNIGLERVLSRYTLFLNPDAAIEPDALQILVDFMDGKRQVGVCGPATVLGEDRHGQRYQATGKRPSALDIAKSSLPKVDRADLYRVIYPGSAPFRTGWICGAVFLVRTELMRRLNGFDPRFFLYWEETDVCRRIEDLGFENWAVGGALARHVGGASSTDDTTKVHGCIAQHYFQSRRYYLIKHHGWVAATFAEAFEFGVLVFRAIVDLAMGRPVGRLIPRLQCRLFSVPPKPP